MATTREMIVAEPGAGDGLIEQSDAARMLSVSETTVRRLCDMDGLPHYVIGSRYKFDRAEVVAWIKSRRRVKAAPTDGDGEIEKHEIRVVADPAGDRQAEVRELRRRMTARAT